MTTIHVQINTFNIAKDHLRSCIKVKFEYTFLIIFKSSNLFKNVSIVIFCEKRTNFPGKCH